MVKIIVSFPLKFNETSNLPRFAREGGGGGEGDSIQTRIKSRERYKRIVFFL